MDEIPGARVPEEIREMYRDAGLGKEKAVAEWSPAREEGRREGVSYQIKEGDKDTRQTKDVVEEGNTELGKDSRKTEPQDAVQKTESPEQQRRKQPVKAIEGSLGSDSGLKDGESDKNKSVDLKNKPTADGKKPKKSAQSAKKKVGGGAYRNLLTVDENGLRFHRNHMPAKSVSPLSKGEGPAICMT